ncbi:MAG: Rrf2 family transcriptional regulator, partial [Treponema sp.]|nr:Rrf2 family transcriptional regulator [Treponema sp.]
RLRKAGIVASTRGPGGGFSFAQPLDKITVKSLIDAAGEKLGLTFCDKRFETCNRVGDCLSHHVWAGAAGVMNSYFEDITLASLLAKYADPAAASQKE